MREKKATLSSFFDLTFLECQTIEKDGWVLFILSVRLEDYWKLVSDESGHLRRCLFNSNGWDFLSANPVNEEIECTLTEAADSRTLNNGVTVIATTATIQGKAMRLQDVQIIDGLQTTKIICRHFQGSSTTSKDENLFVKIIVTPDVHFRDTIISHTSYHDQPLSSADLQAIRNRLNSA